MLAKSNKLQIATLIFLLAFAKQIFAGDLQLPKNDSDTLMEAIEKNDENKVDELLKNKVNPNARGEKSKFITPLGKALLNNNKRIVESLIKYGADVQAEGVACLSLRDVNQAEMLIDHGIDINKTKCKGASPLHEAVYLEALDTAELLLKHGANINNQETIRNLTPLQYAVLHGKKQAVKWLLEHGADVNLPDAHGEMAIYIGVFNKDNVEIMKMLLEHGAKITSQDVSRITSGACRAGNLETLEFLTSRGNTPDFDECYIVLSRLVSPDEKVLKWLMRKAKIKTAVIAENSLLHVAVEKNNLKMAKLLIAAGTDVNGKNRDNKTPLACALEGMTHPTSWDSNYKEMFALLLAKGADPNIMYGHNHAGDNTINLLQELAYISYVCDKNANEITLQFSRKRTAQTIEVAELLISYGANVNVRDDLGNTLLHKAALRNNVPMIKMLVLHGADLKATNKGRRTPLLDSIIYNGDLVYKLRTIETLCSLEVKAGGKFDWAQIKNIANKSRKMHRDQILILLEQLEKDSLNSVYRDNYDELIAKIVEDAPKTLQERLDSCDATLALAAVEEVINNPATLERPLDLFAPARTLFFHGMKDEAVFWYYAAQLRVKYQLIFENGDRGQLFAIMQMTIGPPILNYAFQNTANLNLILDHVLEWDKKTPNPFCDKTKSEKINQQIEKIYSGFLDMKVQLVAEKDKIEREANLAAPNIEKMYAETAKRCSKYNSAIVPTERIH